MPASVPRLPPSAWWPSEPGFNGTPSMPIFPMIGGLYLCLLRAGLGARSFARFRGMAGHRGSQRAAACRAARNRRLVRAQCRSGRMRAARRRISRARRGRLLNCGSDRRSRAITRCSVRSRNAKQRAMLHLALSFFTWRTLARESGLKQGAARRRDGSSHRHALSEPAVAVLVLLAGAARAGLVAADLAPA